MILIGKHMIDDNTLMAFKVSYPTKGKKWCIENLMMTDTQIRYYAGVFSLVSQFKNNLDSKRQMADKLRGRKRPEHSAYLKEHHPLKGKHHSVETKKKIKIANIVAHKEGRLKVDNFRGHHHSDASKLKISKAGIGRKFTKERTEKILKTKMLRYGKVGFPTSNTYSHAKRGYYKIGNKTMYFRSKWEANYAIYLVYLKKSGIIKKWEFEPDTFWFKSIKRGVRSYLPDFKVFNNDVTFEYHEVKGWMDKKSVTKLKRMKKYYPHIKIVLIDEPAYKELKNKLGAFLKFY